MKKTFICLLTLLLMSAVSIETNAQHIVKGFFLRTKEKKNWTVTKSIKTEIEPYHWSYEYKDTTMCGYYECVLTLDLDCATEAYPYINNPDIQEDLVKTLTTTNEYTDSLVVVMANYVKDEKTLDKVCEKLKNLDDYDSYFFDNNEDLIKEMSKYSDSRRFKETTQISLWVNNGLLYCGYDFSNIIAIYDTETGRRIEPSELFKSQPVTDYRDDTVTVTKITKITKYLINDRIPKNCPYLTPYAVKLMEKSKTYYARTNENQYGDLVRTYYFDEKNVPEFLRELDPTDPDITDVPTQTRYVHIPKKLQGCQNTDKVINRMLDVMFGKHDGDVDSLIFNSVNSMMKDKPWREYETLLEIGDGLVSFGFENRQARRTSDSHLVVFDKASGDEITVGDLIKDKKGFVQFVNSFNLYVEGFLFDTTQMKNGHLDPKFKGEQFKSYVNKDGGHVVSLIIKFGGLYKLPVMWWFPFTQYDNVLVPVEFKTEIMPFYLDYNDIRKFINPKYLPAMDAAAAFALKKKQ
ncbi:MAG: hypothetical protein J6T96_07400 [Bacteroidales bacterium]|nr:hypothetical protein [Bacteroidales bacterium]